MDERMCVARRKYKHPTLSQSKFAVSIIETDVTKYLGSVVMECSVLDNGSRHMSGGCCLPDNRPCGRWVHHVEKMSIE